MGLKDDYKIEKITYHQAMDIVVQEHYLHRKCPCSEAFGLIRKADDAIMGVVVYGVSCSSTLLKGICGPEEASNVYELTRLWVDDIVPKNGESFLIGNTISKVNKQIIVSFAEIQQGHQGGCIRLPTSCIADLAQNLKTPK